MRFAVPLAIVLAVAGVMTTSVALAASDQVLRAFYCASVLDVWIAQEQQFIASLERVPAAQRDTLSLDMSRSAVRQLVTSRDRVKAYAISGLDVGNPTDVTASSVALRRGEIDFKQCAIEQSQTANQCVAKCVLACTNPNGAGCVPGCDTSCGEPTCARTAACADPTWLPY